MENASKALIIAGAILLSILIIGLGMQVYNNASATMGSANMSSQEITSHNSQFEAYEGRVKGSQIRSLIALVKQNNIDFEDRTVELEGEAGFSLENTTSNQIKNNTTYFVSFEYDENNLLNKVIIDGYGAGNSATNNP